MSSRFPWSSTPDPDRYVLVQGLAALAFSQGYDSDWSGLFAGLVIAILPVLLAYLFPTADPRRPDRRRGQVKGQLVMRKPLLAGIAAALACIAAGAVAVAASASTVAQPTCAALFDDFSYSGPSDPLINQRGWTVRTNAGGPGVPGASWPASNVSFPTVDGAKSLQLQASTNGTGAGTSQAEFLHQRKFFEGTYAARVKFADSPVSGNDGDHLVETFFTITPLDFPMDPNYGEIDFEYLPNGGWGEPSNIFFETTWETYRPDPWEAVNTHTEQRQSFNGWHDLMFTVSGGHVKYFIDGAQVADHSGTYYPETPMSINFNLWFIDTVAHSGGTSTYRQQVDYLLHTVGEVLTPAQVSSRVNGYRASGVTHTDTVGTGGGTCPPQPGAQNQLLAGQRLTTGQRLTSSNARFNLVMQTDGNLVLYDGTPGQNPIWATGTWNLPNDRRPTHTDMQTDGNLVLYNDTNQAAWASNSWGPNRINPYLELQNDGNLVIYHNGRNPLWASGTTR